MRSFVALLTAVSLLALVGGAVGCGGSSAEAPVRTIEAPEHTIVEVENASFISARRLIYRVQFPEKYTQEQAQLIAESIIEARHRGDKDKVNALAFWFYFPGSDPSGGADGTMFWAPGGNWAKADTVQAGEYDSFEFLLRFWRQ